MLNDYEQHVLNTYLANTAASITRSDPAARHLIDWVSDQDNRIAFPVTKRRNFWDVDHKRAKVSKKKFRELREFLNHMCSGKIASRDRTAQRLHRLGQVTGLTRTDSDILELLVRYNTHVVFESMIDEIFECPGRSTTPLNIRGRALPMALGLSANKFQLRLKEDAPLVRTGLVKIDRDGDLKSFRGTHRLISEAGDSNVDPIRLLLDIASSSDLVWQDFEHVAVHRDHVESLVKGALDKSALGVNILLHGPPGTGKTEFCKVLARQLGLTLYSVGEADEDGEEPTREERLQELRLAQNLLAGNRKALILFDEMDDLLETSFGGLGMFGARLSLSAGTSASKVHFHRLLETSPVPVLWTMNDAREVSPAILRRMMFAIELRVPTTPVRARVWSRQLDAHGIKAAPEDVQDLASDFSAAPGVAAGATAAASLADGGIATVRLGVNSLTRLLSCGMPPQGTSRGFDPALIQADVNPATLAERLATAGSKNFSLCLQGPPGTGKSAYVRYLAERLGLEVLQKRTSDLMSMWVGQTERLIASAFAEARDSEAFLVFDEADSLLADRRSARRNWEVSQVNEMLTWMESHPLPFACTTNFGEHFDPAALRRFVFKITLDYLAPEQVKVAFRSYFDLAPPASLSTLAVLTPGDFEVVRRKAGVLGRLEDPESLAGMLHAECAAKPDRPRDIGFRR